MTPQEINAKADELAMEAAVHSHNLLATHAAAVIKDKAHLLELLACVEACRPMLREVIEMRDEITSEDVDLKRGWDVLIKPARNALAAYDEAVNNGAKK